MEVKRIPQTAVGQAVDPSSQPSHQDHKQGDKSKKKKSKNPSDTSANNEKKEPHEAEWEEADLSRQPVDSETVAEMLSHSHPPTQTAAQIKPAYIKKKISASPPPKLNRKY